MYSEVIRICMLNDDLDALPGKDLTEIGEKGFNLSGGQKARISLARAIYARADIYLLDDPLAALDEYVGKAIFELCIYKYLKGKTRVLITNNQQYLSYADKMLIFEKGRIVQQGHFQDLVNINGYFKDEFMVELKQNKLDHKDNDNLEANQQQDAVEKKLIESEERVFGSVRFSVYKSYYLYSGGVIALIIGFLAMAG